MNTIYKNIRFFLLVAGVFCSMLPAFAQTTNTGYFMKSQHSRTSFNPALRPEQGYFGFPFLANIYADVKTNTFNLDHFIFPGGTQSKTFLHEDISNDDFLKNIGENNYANIDLSYSLFSMGFYSGESFWTIDLGVKAHIDANVPYSFFEFGKKGFSANNPSIYNIGNSRGTATGYGELGLGYSRPFLDNTLVVGVKGKLLLGFVDTDFYLKNLTVDAGKDVWTMSSHAMIEGSAPGLKATYKDDGTLDELEMDGFGITGSGFGFDLGATYKLSTLAESINGPLSDIVNRFTVSAALTDIGFISWSKKNSVYLATDPMEQVVTGEYIFSTNGDENDENSFENQIEKIGDAVEDAMELREDSEKSGDRSTSLRMKMNFGLEYEFLKDKLSGGLLSTTYFNKSHSVTEFTMAGAYKPVSWFEAGLSYSFVHSKFNTFGLALNFVPSKGLNLFLASDYIIPHWNSDYVPTTMKAYNVQFGLTIPLGQKH